MASSRGSSSSVFPGTTTLIVLEREVTTEASLESSPDKKIEAPLTLSIWICGRVPLASI